MSIRFRKPIMICLAAAGAAFAVRAQTTPPEALPAGFRAVQLPLSGRTGAPGDVNSAQSPIPSGVQSVNTINTNIQVQGAYQGSVPSERFRGAMTLSLDNAVQRGLQYNLGGIEYRNAVRQAAGESKLERSYLLPQVNSALTVVNEQINLAALGFSPATIPGFSNFPTVVGPFHYFDVRAGVEQSLLDLTRLRNYRSSQENVRAETFSAKDARDLIVLAVTGAYLQVVASRAQVESARAQVATAQATYKQAVDRHDAGVAARIDVTRSQVELQTQQQRLTSVENDLAKRKITLARLIGLSAGQEYSINDDVPFAPLTSITLDQALSRAYGNRNDLKAAESQVRAAELTRKAAVAEKYPTISVGGDYGVIGTDPTASHGTFSMNATVRMPIFNGRRSSADIEQADAALAQRRAEYEDLRGRIEAEVRTAFLDLTAAANQVAVAESNRKLAADTLQQARDRFAAGVTDTIEVVQAQEAVATAEQDYIQALYAHNLAKASLARALGQADQNIRQFLGRP
jgi:outer membrane protein TolC